VAAARSIITPGPEPSGFCNECGDELAPDGHCQFCEDWDEWWNSEEKQRWDEWAESLRQHLVRERIEYIARTTGRMAIPALAIFEGGKRDA